MITETITDFIAQYEKCYDLIERHPLLEGLYVYLCRATGNIEVFDSELDYQYTLLPWVSLKGTCPMVAFPIE